MAEILPFSAGNTSVYSTQEVDNLVRRAVGGGMATLKAPVDIAPGSWSADSTDPPVMEGDTWQKGVISHGLGSPEAAIIAAWDEDGYSFTWLRWARIDNDTIHVWVGDVPTKTITFKVIA